MSEFDPQVVTPSALRGHGIGIIVCALFAALWAHWARPLWSGLPGVPGWAAVLVVVAASGALVAAGIAMLHRGRRLALATRTGGTVPRAMRRGFVLVLVGEIVALNVAAYLLIGHHAVQYLAPAVAVIVGLHFLPLAGLFRAPHFRVTAVVMALAGVLAAMFMAAGGSALAANGVADLACAIALWATGFASWFRMHRAVAAVRALDMKKPAEAGFFANR